MAAISTYLVDKFLDTLGNTSFAVAAVYAQLHTGDPGTAGTANVAAQNTRQVVGFSPASAESKAINTTLTWLNAPASETYSHVSLWDASTSGNFLWAGALTTPIAVTIGNTFQILSGSLTVGVS